MFLACLTDTLEVILSLVTLSPSAFLFLLSAIFLAEFTQLSINSLKLPKGTAPSGRRIGNSSMTDVKTPKSLPLPSPNSFTDLSSWP